jgi:hypothetical protein
VLLANTANRNAREKHQMKKPAANPTERKCPECNGTGFPKVVQPVQPGRRIYPAPRKVCGGKGRIKETANWGGLTLEATEGGRLRRLNRLGNRHRQAVAVAQ